MNRLCHRGTILLAWAAMLLPVMRAAQQPKNAKTDPAAAKHVVELPMVYAGVRYESGNRRDPFLNPLLLKKEQKLQDEEEPGGQAPPGIGGMYIAQVTLLGIALQGGEQTAIFRGTDNRAYFLREGDKFFDGSLTRIGTDSVVLARETRYKSGRVVKQEVTKRLRP
jgi:hypothetical protein